MRVQIFIDGILQLVDQILAHHFADDAVTEFLEARDCPVEIIPLEINIVGGLSVIGHKSYLYSA